MKRIVQLLWIVAPLFAFAETHFSWRVTEAVKEDALVHANISKRFQKRVKADQLQQGLTVNEVEPSAVVLLTALEEENQPLNLQMLNAQGVMLQADQVNMINTDTLSSDVAGGVFKLLPRTHIIEAKALLENGVSLQADNAKGDYLLTVIDKDSPYQLELATARAQYFFGEDMTITAVFRDHNENASVYQMQGNVYFKNGKKKALHFTQTENKSYQAKLTLIDIEEGPAIISVDSKGFINNKTVNRHVESHVRFSKKTASLDKIDNHFVDEKGNLHVQFAINANKEGNFAVRALLYVQDNNAFKPFIMTHSAKHLTKGRNIIDVPFNKTLLANYQAPYRLALLELRDQAQESIVDSMPAQVITATRV